MTLSSTSISFGSVVAGATSSAKTVTLTNHLAESLAFNGAAVTSGFAVASNTCGSTIAAGASCTVGVTFSPSAVGAATGTLTFTDFAGTQSVSLSGTGTAPITLSSGSLSFGTVTIGSTSSARTVTLTNHLTSAVNFSSIAVTTGFAISSNTCGTTVAASSSCAIGVTFTPAAAGSVTGTLTFTDAAIGSPQTVTLSGSGSTSSGGTGGGGTGGGGTGGGGRNND